MRHTRKATLDDFREWLDQVYPTRVLQDLDFDKLDVHLPLDQLPALLARIAAVRHANAVLEPEIVKSHVLHVGYGQQPDWEALNREFSRSERESAVAGAGGEIVYWNILISRVGPFWTDYWNTFRIQDDRVVPELTDPAPAGDWHGITRAVRAELDSFGLYEVDTRIRAAAVKWMFSTQSRTHRPTVYDALFSEIY